MPGRRFQFGAFELDEGSGELRKHGLKIQLQERPLQVLILLLERAGRLARREEIRNALWLGDTFVDFDNAISTAVWKLREALGDSSENPRFIETVARRGYRFLAPVAKREEPAPLRMITRNESSPGPQVGPAESTATRATANPWLPPLLFWSAFTALAAGVALAALFLVSRAL